MSIQEKQKIACPACQTVNEIEVYKSLNPSRQLNAVSSILEDKMQSVKCKCGASIRLEPDFIYMDLKNKMCIAAFPSAALANRKKYEETAKISFDAAFGSLMQNEGVQKRVTFGWPAFREKVLALSKGLSDVDLELAKLALIKESGELPTQDNSLRLLEITATDLVFGWHDNLPPHKVTTALSFELSILDHIRDNPADWLPLRDKIDQGLFIDLASVLNEE